MMFAIILILILITVLVLLLYFNYNKEFFVSDEDPYIIDIATGANHSVFLNKYRTLYSCGKNVNGRLGTGNSSSIMLPVPLENIDRARKIFVGNVNTFFITTQGVLYATGENSNGQLGIGTLDNQFTPVPIPFFKSIAIRKVAVGWYHTLFLSFTNDVYVCGDNRYGQLADGTTTNTIVPIKLGLKCRDIAAGQGHSVFLGMDKKVYTAGWNWYGQLGNSSTRNSNVPFLIENIPEIEHVHAGMSTTLLITPNYALYVCGDNTNGQLALQREITNQRGFTLLKIENEDIKYVSSGQSHTLFMTLNGDIYAVGSNSKGQLGIGHNNTIYKPEKITFFKEPIVKMAAGAVHTVFLTEKGIVYATGDNSMGGQLGVNNITDTNKPVLCDIEIEKNKDAITYKMDIVGFN